MDPYEAHVDLLYRDEYFQIQQMNNQLINSQRALVKSNQQLKRALLEVQNANDRIAQLELDELTGLYRTSTFFERTEERARNAPEKKFEMLALNIAHYALVNEMFGRKASRQLLRELALFLCGLDTSGQGVFCRATGDLFYIFMPEETKFAELLHAKLILFFSNYPLPVHLLGRIGVCPCKGGKIRAEKLCDRARLALDTLTPQSTEQIAYYNETLHEQLRMEHRILDSVRDALFRHEFRLYLQPKVDMVTRKQIGAEALIRWIHPEMGFIPPDRFIPLLEKEDLIYRVDQYIWEEACKVMQQRKKLGLAAMPTSVNLARSDLYQPDLPQVLDRLLREYELAPEELRLEIIERTYTDDSDHIFSVLKGLREEGFCIEMDDFGVGASSLSMAAEMPVDVLKLDRSFVNTSLNSERHTKIVQFIIELARTLQMKIIAEGVETEEEARLLLTLGCRYAQGYLFGRPQPAENFLKEPE